MGKNYEYFYKKCVDWVFRKKSILYIFVLALFREISALNISETIVKWTNDPTLQDVYIHYPLMALNFIFSGGNWTVVWILVFLISLFKILEVIESKNKNQTETEIDKQNDGQAIINNGYIEKQININKVEKVEI